MSISATYRVAGMSCEHCVNVVGGELRKLPGVSEVTVDLERETAVVVSDAELDRGDVEAAVDEAGYELRP